MALQEWDHKENMTTNHSNRPASDIRDTIRERDLLATRANALGDGLDDGFDTTGDELDETLLPLYDGDQLEREERAALRRVQGLSTELEDVTEVEYRQLRLERVVLAGVWTDGTADDAENLSLIHI